MTSTLKTQREYLDDCIKVAELLLDMRRIAIEAGETRQACTAIAEWFADQGYISWPTSTEPNDDPLTDWITINCKHVGSVEVDWRPVDTGDNEIRLYPKERWQPVSLEMPWHLCAVIEAAQQGMIGNLVSADAEERLDLPSVDPYDALADDDDPDDPVVLANTEAGYFDERIEGGLDRDGAAELEEACREVAADEVAA
jgi:hypothetical protein